MKPTAIQRPLALHSTRGLASLVVGVTLVVTAGCGGEHAPVAPGPAAAPLTFDLTRDEAGTHLTATLPAGALPQGLRDRLRAATPGGAVDITVRDAGAAGDPVTARLVGDLVEVGARLSEGRVTFRDKALTIRGQTFDDAGAFEDLAKAAGRRVEAAVTVEVALDAVTHVPGTGWLRPSDGPPAAPLALKADGRDVTLGASGRLPAGLYTLPDGREVAVADGRTTWFAPGAEAAVVVAGRRLALDTPIPLVGLDAADALSFQAEAVREKAKAAQGFDLFNPRRVEGALWTLPSTPAELAAKATAVQGVVLHTSLTTSAKASYDQLLERGLSTHFIIDVDGTLYQGLDPVYVAYHAGDYNAVGIGVDLVGTLPNLVKTPDAPAFDPQDPRVELLAKHPRAKSAVMSINGAKAQSYGYTEAQYRTLGTLLRALATVFPKVGEGAPRDRDGRVPPFVLEDAGDLEGVLAHWHLAVDRWDPGPGMDWERVDAMLKGGPAAAGGR